MCVTVMVVTGHSVALNRRSHLFSTMSSLHDVVVHNNFGHVILVVQDLGGNGEGSQKFVEA
jgi:hypothetical protein